MKVVTAGLFDWGWRYLGRHRFLVSDNVLTDQTPVGEAARNTCLSEARKLLTVAGVIPVHVLDLHGILAEGDIGDEAWQMAGPELARDWKPHTKIGDHGGRLN